MNDPSLSGAWIGDRFALIRADTRFAAVSGCKLNQEQVIRMVRTLPRRTVLTSLLALPAVAMLATACSDSGEAEAQDKTPQPSTETTAA